MIGSYSHLVPFLLHNRLLFFSDYRTQHTKERMGHTAKPETSFLGKKGKSKRSEAVSRIPEVHTDDEKVNSEGSKPTN